MKNNIVGVGLQRLNAAVQSFKPLLALTVVAVTVVVLLIFRPMSAQAATQESILQEHTTQLKRIADALEKIAGTRQR